MTRAINLNSKEWRDLVFANRNQDYGAYEIRKTSSQRHLMAVGIMILLGGVLSLLPIVLKKIFPADNIPVDTMVDGRLTMSEYQPTERDKEILEMVKQVEALPNLKATVKFTPPVIRPDEQVNEADEMLAQEVMSNTPAAISVETVVGVVGGTEDIVDHLKEKGAITGEPAEGNTPVSFVEQMPQPVGGDKELMSYLSKNIKYPVIAIENNVQGTVLLRFVVGKDGSIKDVTVLRSLDASCDKEAVRVVSSMPQWVPGRQNGVAVAVYYTLPVKFKLNN